jgi:hypothetical protein
MSSLYVNEVFMSSYQSILSNPNIEISTKYLFYFFYDQQPCGDPEFEIKNDDLSKMTGMSKAKIYRARSQLIKLGLISHRKTYCPITGKKISDFYSFTGFK